MGRLLESIIEAIDQFYNDLRKMLLNGSLVEKKNLLRSFVRELRYNDPELIVEYTLPIAPDGVQPFTREVLSMDKVGRAYGNRTRHLRLERPTS